MTKTSMASVRRQIRARRAKREKWREIGASFPGVPLGTLCRIAHDESYEPKSHVLRAHLGLEPLPVEVTPCARCGRLHAFQRRCPGAPTKPRRTYDISYKRLREVMQADKWNSE